MIKYTLYRCSEKKYKASHFNGKVSEYPFGYYNKYIKR